MVIKQEVKYGRTGYLKIEDGQVKIDTSNGEYGEAIFDLEIVEETIRQYKKLKNAQ